jgi:thioredoxin-like negative regulator of GroEL
MSKSIINVINNKKKCGEINNVLKKKNDNQNQNHCVIYSMKGCPYCEQLDGELKKMENTMENKYTNKGTIAKIMSDQLPNVHEVEDAQLNGFPTIIIVSNGKRNKTFNGPRSSDELINFLLQNGVIAKQSSEDTNNMMGGAKKKTLRKGKKGKKTKKSLRKGKKSLRKGKKSMKSKKAKKSLKKKKSKK